MQWTFMDSGTAIWYDYNRASIWIKWIIRLFLELCTKKYHFPNHPGFQLKTKTNPFSTPKKSGEASHRPCDTIASPPSASSARARRSLRFRVARPPPSLPSIHVALPPLVSSGQAIPQRPAWCSPASNPLPNPPPPPPKTDRRLPPGRICLSRRPSLPPSHGKRIAAPSASLGESWQAASLLVASPGDRRPGLRPPEIAAWVSVPRSFPCLRCPAGLATVPLPCPVLGPVLLLHPDSPAPAPLI